MAALFVFLLMWRGFCTAESRALIQGRKATADPSTRCARSEFVTFLNLHDFLTNKSFVFSIGFGEKSKKSQALRMTKGWGTRPLQGELQGTNTVPAHAVWARPVAHFAVQICPCCVPWTSYTADN